MLAYTVCGFDGPPKVVFTNTNIKPSFLVVLVLAREHVVCPHLLSQ